MRTKLNSMICAAVITIFLVGSSLHSQKAEASGFPTVDIAALIQRLMGYVTQLQDYATQLTSTETEISQLLQMYEDYTQMLREYDHYLRQLRGLQEFISDAQWQQLLEVFAPYYGESDFAALPALDPDSATYDEDVRTLLNRYVSVPLEAADFDARLASVDLDAEHYRAQNTRIAAAYSRQLDLYRQVTRNETDAVQRDEEIEAYSELLRDLGDESDVATMQTIATGVGMMLKQEQAAIRLQNQQLLNTELPSATRAADRAAMLDREIVRLERAMSTETPSFTVDVDDF